MCTIGSAFDGDNLVTFKQCDLKEAVNFNVPKIIRGEGDISYVELTRKGSEGIWASVNNYGVSFVAADAYMQGVSTDTYELHGAPGAPKSDIFDQYRKIVSKHKTAKAAAEFMLEFYKTFESPDIILICDINHRFFIESNDKKPLVVPLNDQDKPELNRFFVSTNHFRFLHGGTTFPENHSTYLRLERAEAILQSKSNLSGVKELLSDQYYGPSVLSLCRKNRFTPEGEEPYFTQASAYFVCTPKAGAKDGEKMVSKVEYFCQINGNPRDGEWRNGTLCCQGQSKI